MTENSKCPIPLQSLENHIAILAKTGAGKTYTAKAIAEYLLDQDKRVCIIDPASAWWGLKSSADGKKEGYPVVIFGGKHGDIAIGRNHGKGIAEIIGTTSTPAIIDTRSMSVSERTEFFTDFAETLLQKNEGPLHLIIDEAHLFMPQGKVASPQSGKMLNAGNNLVSLGRGVGLRIIMISQRPAKLHKDSLTQAETLIAMRVIAPQDRKAIQDWMLEWADAEQGKELMQSLPSLPTGEGWIWAPEAGILERKKFPIIRTYNSSSAPDGKTGEVTLAPIDLPVIEKRLEDVARDVLDNDPRRLKMRIIELEQELKEKPESVDQATIDEMMHGAENKGYCRGLDEGYDLAISTLENHKNQKTVIAHVNPPEAMENPKTAVAISKIAKAAVKHIADSGQEKNISAGDRKILSVLAQYPQGRSKRQIALLSGYSVKSGTFGTYLSRLRSNGWIVGSGGNLQITQEGISALGIYDPLPVGEALLQHWFRQLNKGPRAILEVLAKSWPQEMTRDSIAESAGYSATSGTFGTYLSKLRTLELIEIVSGGIRASDDLFQEAA